MSRPLSFVKQQFKIQASFFSRLADDRQFVGFFTILTLYALFVPDFDQWLGDKTSTEVVTVFTNLVVFLFLFEIVAQSLGKTMYLCRAYFWLDLVALRCSPIMCGDLGKTDPPRKCFRI